MALEQLSSKSSTMGELEVHCYNNYGCYFVMPFMISHQFLVAPVFKVGVGFIAQGLLAGSVNSSSFSFSTQCHRFSFTALAWMALKSLSGRQFT